MPYLTSLEDALGIMHLCIQIQLFITSLAVTVVSAVHAHRYIVSFQSHAHLSALEQALDSALYRTPFHCTFGPRSPAAYRHNTDFVVLVTKHLGAVRLVSTLTTVRFVHSDSLAGANTGRAPLASFGSSSNARDGLRLHPFDVGSLWAKGYTGAGVKVAVFDTGVAPAMENIANVAEITDWTSVRGIGGGGGGERTYSGARPCDPVGHGTFVAGIIGGRNVDCPGMAPDASLYIMRVFTSAQLSYTSWFLDAFNYALHVGVDVLNLSVGGPDYADRPFIDKVNELTAAGVIVVSAIGNDGPRWGTLNNPGDLLDVVGVGGAEPDGSIAPFSSRGPTWIGGTGTNGRRYGRVKPDIVAYARNLVAPSHTDVNACRTLSGTSVASPVVAAAIAIVISSVPAMRRRLVVNPATVKRALMQSAKLLPAASVYEQGAGLLDVQAAVDVMRQIDLEFNAFHKRRAAIQSAIQSQARARAASSTENDTEAWLTMKKLLAINDETPPLVDGPRAYLFPEKLDLDVDNCQLYWPHCAQPLTLGGDWHTVNISILNLAGTNARVADVSWVPFTNLKLLEVAVSKPRRFWPWAAGLGVHLRAVREPDTYAPTYIEGVLRVEIITDLVAARSIAELPIRASVHRKPPKSRRLLFDTYHSIRYPPGYVPRDSLAHETKDMLDWLGDHPSTNFRTLFQTLTRAGYHVDVIDTSVACLGAKLGEMYGALLILDSEDFFFTKERAVIRDAVVKNGLALVVAAEWDDPDLMRDLQFSDDNTRSRWSPIVGGGNVLALNQLLKPFGIAFGTGAFTGTLSVDGARVSVDSGAPIVTFPKHGEIISSVMKPMLTKAERAQLRARGVHNPTMGHPELQHMLGIAFFGKGAVVVLGDTHCIDDAYGNPVDAVGPTLMLKLLHHVLRPPVPRKPLFYQSRLLRSSLLAHDDDVSPTLHDENAFMLFRPHSRVLAHDASRELQSERDVRAVCAQYDALVVHVPIRSEFATEKRTTFSLPVRPHAQLIGSDTRYFKTVSEPVTFRFVEPKQTTPHHHHQHEETSISAIRTVAWVTLLIGVVLVFLAVAAPWNNPRRRGGERERDRIEKKHPSQSQSIYNRTHIRRITVNPTPLRARTVREY